MGEARVSVGKDGRLTASGEPTRLLREPASYRVAEGPNDAFVLLREVAEPSARGRVLMMGELVTRMTVVEIMNIVTSAQWGGELHVMSPEGKRELTMAQGALKHARTEVERERIGELLVQAGLIERRSLSKLLPEQLADERFGQLLVRVGLLAEDVLFKQLQLQTEAIFYAAMLVESGMYWFVAPPESAAAPATTVHLPVQGLLMEGVQRIDEMALFRERIPHNRFYPAEKPGTRREGLDAASTKLLELCDGSRSIDELQRETALGEFTTLKVVYGLLRGGQLTLRRGPTLDTSAARRMVRQFNEVVRDIFVVIATYGSMERTSHALSAWLASGPHGKALGEQVDIDGTLDAPQVIARLQSLGSDDPLQELHRALQELAAYALFLASNGLPAQEQRLLARDVNHRLNQLRL